MSTTPPLDTDRRYYRSGKEYIAWTGEHEHGKTGAFRGSFTGNTVEGWNKCNECGEVIWNGIRR